MSPSSPPDWTGRLQRLRQRLDEASLDALVVSSAPNLRYLSGFVGSAGLLVVTPAGAVLIADGRYEATARAGVSDGTLASLDVEPVVDRYDAALGRVLERFAVSRAGFEADSVTVTTRASWGREAPGIDWEATSGVVEDLRVIKDASEIATLRRAARMLSDVARRLPDIVEAGRTERETARAIDLTLERAGFERPAFDTIVASGPHSAHPHAVPGSRRLADGDLLVLDFGGVLDGYCVDLTRMAAIGRVSERAREVVRAVDEAQRAAIAAVTAGVSGADVDRAARDVLEARGLGAAFVHSTGHGLGLEVHEAPRLARSADPAVLLRAGMVCTVEPGAYLEGLGGARLEDDVLVTENGHEVLTDAPRDLMTIGTL